MILILADSTDLLANEVTRRLRAAAMHVFWIREVELFETVAFAFERYGQPIVGYLRHDEGPISFADLSGVMVRLPRTWWPSPALTFKTKCLFTTRLPPRGSVSCRASPVLSSIASHLVGGCTT